MIGIGPFIPQHDTPFARFPAGSVDMTSRLYAILRLALPQALIPSTTAMATLSPDGRLRGILAGANVVMPNLSPEENRAQYSLYDNKASLGAESAQGVKALEKELATIGYHIDWSRGDSPTAR
jgi:biotin synthase